VPQTPRHSPPGGWPRGSFSSTFRPQETLTAQVLAGDVRAVRALGPQAVIAGGDLIDNDQANELGPSLLSYQLDAETGLRAFMTSGRRAFLQPYLSARPLFSPTLKQLQDFVQERGITDAMPLVSDVYDSHSTWENDVARPLAAAPTGVAATQRLALGKSLVDRIQGDLAQLHGVLKSQADAAMVQAQELLRRAAIFTALLIFVFGCAAIVADYIRARALAALVGQGT